MSHIEENYKYFYNMCMGEHEKAETNLIKYKLRAAHIIGLLDKRGNKEDIDRFSKDALADLTLISVVLRKFNDDVQKTEAQLSLPIIEPEVDCSKKPAAEKLQMSEKVEFETITDHQREIDCTNFTYPKISLSQYPINFEGEFIISYVKNAKKQMFYLLDSKSSTYNSGILSMTNYFNESPFSYKTLPGSGVVFGLYLDNYMFRAVRANLSDPSDRKFKVFLLDVGEITEISVNSSNMYLLSDIYQAIPAQAILCKLVKVNDGIHSDPVQFLKSNQYAKQLYKIQNIVDDVLHVELIDKPTKSKSNSVATLTEKSKCVSAKEGVYPITHPFAQFRCENDVSARHNIVSQEQTESTNTSNQLDQLYKLENIQLRKSELNPNAKNFNITSTTAAVTKLNETNEDYNFTANNERKTVESPATASYNFNNNLSKVTNFEWTKKFSPKKDFTTTTVDSDLHSNSNLQCATNPFSTSNNYQRNTNGLTKDELQTLYEEPKGTQNAMVAVMGYNPQDDKRICKYYDPRIGGCFKGANCRLEHVSLLKDGWTRDKKLTQLRPRIEMTYPEVGSIVTIIPTYIPDIDSFYAHIPMQNKDLPTLAEIQFQMNGTETVDQHVKLTRPPVELELVIAKYKDNNWYRASVISVIDDVHVKVFYVDYGNCFIVSVDDIRKWDERFDFYPYQAFHCRLHNIEKIKPLHFEAIEYFKIQILNQEIQAKVVGLTNQLYVQLKDNDGFDIGDLLCAYGYAKLINSSSNFNQILPM